MTATEYLNHPVHQKTEQLLKRLKDKEVIEKLEIEKQDFFKTAAAFSVDRLKVSLPSLFVISELNAVSAEFENALAQINAFIGNDNFGHINNAVNNIISALTYVRNFPFPISKADLDFSKSISNFQETIQNKYSQSEELQKRL